MYKYTPFNALIGKTLTDISVNDAKDEMIITTTDGQQFKLYHEQDCCESVSIEEIIGELDNLIGSPILTAEERKNDQEEDGWGDTSTWTFYELATAKGYVTIRWLGSSNGDYSESVSFVELTPVH